MATDELTRLQIEALNKPSARGELVFVKGDQIRRDTDRFRPTLCGLHKARAPRPAIEDCYNAVELFIEPTLASQEAPEADVGIVQSIPIGNRV